MVDNFPSNRPVSPGPKQKINEKIADIKKTEKDIPAILIVHDLRDWSVVYMSERGRQWLKTTMKELQALGPDYHTRFFNPEDSSDYVPKILGLLERNNDDEIISNFQQVRPSPDHEWGWFLSCTKIVLRDDEGKPLLTLTSAIPVDAQHHIATKARKLLQESNFHRHNKQLFESLTKREKNNSGYDSQRPKFTGNS